MNTIQHDHADSDRLHLGCPACIANVRADQEKAAIADAPRRRCTFHVRYYHARQGWLRDETFTVVLKVPADWTGADVAHHYCFADEVSVAFAESLTNVPDDAVFGAMDTMRIHRVVIGRAETPPAELEQPDLFGDT